MQASFPEGAVSFKLLFTQAPVDKVPFLKGAPTWSADANRDASKPVVHTAAQASHLRYCSHCDATLYASAC